MVDFLKVLGTIISTAGIIAGVIILRKGTESIDSYIGIVQGILTGAVFFFFSNMLMNSEYQTELLEDIRDHFYPDEDSDETGEVEEN